MYIDTATLMNVSAMKKFINKYGDEIRRSGRKIRVPLSVRHELSRHFQRRDYQKSMAAMEAEILLSNNSDLFELQGDNWLNKKDLSEAFADPELLATLTLNKAKGNQTLITNDRMLGENAHDINRWKSCSGYAITVCFINRDGELCKADHMVEESIDHEQNVSIETASMEESSLNEETEQKGLVLDKVEDDSKVKKYRINDGISIKNMAFSAIGFITGIITIHYAKDAVSSTKRVCRALAQGF